MLAVVKNPHTKRPLLEVKGEIPNKLLKYSQESFGNYLEIINDDNTSSNIFTSDWFQQVAEATTPGETVRIYRENLKLTQEQLAKQIGKLTRQNISDIELGRRDISKEIAKKLSTFFKVNVSRFI